jgi:hypothetical protein
MVIPSSKYLIATLARMHDDVTDYFTLCDFFSFFMMLIYIMASACPIEQIKTT